MAVAFIEPGPHRVIVVVGFFPGQVVDDVHREHIQKSDQDVGKILGCAQKARTGIAQTAGAESHVDIGQQKGLLEVEQRQFPTGQTADGNQFQDPAYLADNPVRGRRAGRDPDGFRPGQGVEIQFFFSLDVIGWFAGLPGNFRQADSVAAVVPADYDDGIHLGGKFRYLRLAFTRGIANRVVDFVVGSLCGGPLLYGIVKFDILSRLGDDDGLLEGRQGCQFSQVVNHMALAAGVALQANYFGVITVSNNNGGIPLLGVFANDGLDSDDARAGGIDNFEPGIF